MTAYKATGTNTITPTPPPVGGKAAPAGTIVLTEGNSGSDDSLDTNNQTLSPASGNVPVTLNLAAAPAANGVVITNSGTITATSARAIDVGTGASTAVTATGAKITINNSGTIQTTGTGKGDVFRVNFDMPSGTVIVNNTGTMKSTINSNDSQGVRLGKVYSASKISIANGAVLNADGVTYTPVNTSALIQTNDADAIRAGGVDPSGSTTAYGSSFIVNYGRIIAQDYDAAATLTAVNGIDIGVGQSANVDNFGTIIGDESGLGADVSYNGPSSYVSGGANLNFAANYIVTNESGGTITGNNGAAIASGTATITNSGTITGKATGIASANSASTASNPTITNANGTGILTSGAATITNNASGIIQGTGSIGSAATSTGVNINSGTITNYGVIRETATAANKGGAAVLVGGSTASTLTNYGTISSAAGLAITMGSGADTINLYTGGTINGTIDGGAGSDTLNLYAGSGTTTGTLTGVVNTEILAVNSGSWTIADAETYGSGVTIASGANLTIGPNGSTNATIVDNGTLTYVETGTFTKSQPISGTGKVVQAGTGTLILQNSGNSYSGGTNLNSGTLDVTAAGAAGTGAITFGSGAQTLAIEQAALNADGSFTNTLAGVDASDTIDLRGVGTETATSFNTSTNKLTVTGGSEAVTLQLDSAGAPPSGYAYGVSSDGNGGTLVALDQIATVQSLTTSPSSGYVVAGQTVTITITLSKAVTINGTAPVLNLQGGGTATYASGSGSTKLVFTDTVAQGQDASGIVVTSVNNASSAQDAYDVPVDFSGAVNQPATGPVIDTTPPTVAITSMGGLTNQATQTITGTVDTADSGTTVNVYESYNGGQAKLLGTAPVDGNGKWQTTINLSTGNGAHTIYATDTDAAGNTGTSSSISYDLETTAPPVTITSAGGLTNQPMQTLTGSVDVSADPEAKGTTVTVTDTGTGRTLGTGTVDNNGNFSVNVTLSGDGSHTLQAGDTDQAGNSGFASVTYTLDTTPPAAPTAKLANDTGVSSTDNITSDPTITYTASANGDTLLYKVDNGQYSTTAPTFATDGSADGQHTVSVEEQDLAGNISTASSLTFTLDTTAPTTAPSLSLANDTGSSSTDRVTSDPTITYTAGTNGDTLIYKVGNGSYSSTMPTFGADGTYTVSAEEVDAAGNIGPSSNLTFTLDRTPPGAPSVALINDTGASNSDNITNDSRISYAPATAGDTLLYKVGNGAYTSAAPTFSADGTYTVSTEEVDKAGNVGPASSLTFTLDTTPPDVDFTSRDGNVNNATQIVNGQVGVEDAGTTVSIYEDGGTTPVATAIANSGGYFSATIGLGANGTHTLTASATDVAGNTGSTDESLTYNVDTTQPTFTAGNLVISISGNGDGSGDYGDNQATPLVLRQITTDGTYVSQIVLPQTTTTVNGVTESVISAEYGSSSEGSLQLSADGHSLVIAGYGVNAQTYNAGGAAVYGNAALAQSTSIQGGQYTAVPRVIADINANGTIDTSTSLYNVYNGNNPRSVATIDGTSFYISGQGIKGDTTQGVFLVQDGASTVTRIDQSTDTRTAVIYNGQLYVSRDSKQGSGGTSNIAVYGPNLPTGTTKPTILEAIDKSVVITAATGNTVNGASSGSSVNLDPENFFFANATTLYVADGGIPKQGGVGDGGLQKWTFDGTQWNLQYTLSQGLGIVQPGADEGTTGLIGLTGRVDADGTVELYATNQTVGDTDQKYVFGITDPLSATTNPGNSFATLVTAAPDTNIRGISFAPTPITPTIALVNDTGVSATDNITSNPQLKYTPAESGDTLLYKADGATSYSTTAPTFATDGSADGVHTVSVEEKDRGGAIGPASSITFTLDTSADTGTPVSVAFGSNSATAGKVNAANASMASFTVAGLDTDATAVVSFFGQALDGSGSKTVTVAAGANGNYTVDLSGFQDGTIRANIKATDMAGNSATGASVTTVLDTSADTGTPVSVAFGSNAATAGKVNAANASMASFTVAGLDADATAVVSFFGQALDGSGGKTVTVAAGTNGNYTANLSGFRDGTIRASIKATDSAGNTASGAPVTTVLDTSADTGTPVSVAFGNNAAAAGEVNATNAAAASFTVAGLDTDATAVVSFFGQARDGSGAKTVTVNVAANGSYKANLSGFQDGTIRASIKATDSAGNSATGASVTTVLDTSADTGTPVSVAFGNNAAVAGEVNAVNAASASFTVAGLDADATAVVSFYGQALDGSGGKTVSVAAGTNGTYMANLSGFKDGTIRASIKATDTAGNTASGASVTTVLDTSADTGTPVSVAFGNNAATAGEVNAANAAAASFTVAGLDADATAVVSFFGQARDGSGAKTVTVSAAANGSYKANLSGFQDGTIRASVKATDSAGNTASGASVTTVLDTSADTGTPVSVAFGNNAAVAGEVNAANASAAAFTVAGLDTDATAVVSFFGQALDGSGGKTITVAAGSNGTYTANLNGFKDGTVRASIKATDTAGNTASGASVTTVLDTSADTGTPLSVAFAGNGTVNAANAAAASFTVAGLDTDAAAVVSFVGQARDGSGTKTVTVSAAANGSYKANLSGFQDGTIRASIKATDTAGNSATGAPATATLDTSADTGTPLSVAFGNNAATAGEVNAANASTAAFTVAGLDTDATAVVSFYGQAANGSGGKTITVTAGANGNYTANLSGFKDGTIRASIKATDTAGNTATGPSTTTVLDTTAPTVAITSSGGTVTKASQTVTGTGEAGTSIMLTDNGNAIGTTVTVGTNGTWSEKITLSSGSNKLVATDTDKAGNVGTSAAVTYNYGTSGAQASSLHSMVQAMAVMTPSSSASMSPTAAAASQEAHPLAAAHA